ncbi:MAG: hypothetical protein RR089_06725 [Acidaminococcaceae bacterium]
MLKVQYKNDSVQGYCTDIRKARRKFTDIAEQIIQTINYINSAETFTDIVCYPPFHFHMLKGDRLGEYALDIGGRTSGYRLIVIPEDAQGKRVDNAIVFGVNVVLVKIVFIQEVSKHYE